MRFAPLVLALAVSGCIMDPVRQPMPPPPQRLEPATPLTEQQAVDLAAGHARARGLDIRRTTRAFLDAKARWHIDLAGPDSHANLIIDSVSGRILKSRLRLGPPPPPPVSPPPSPPGPPGRPEPRDEPPQARDDNWDE